MSEIKNEIIENKKDIDSSKSILRIENLTKNYENIEALKGVNLDVYKGEVIVILGPSGCGKSTFLRCLNGLEKINSGSIYLEDKLIGKDIAWKEAREKIGMVFQSYELFPHMNVIKNILLGPTKAQKRDPKEAEKQADELLKRVGLFERKFELPRKLSGGQKQRIAIVRSLCMNPEIMLFDEVTATLDPEMVREVLDVILELANGGMTMILVTHEMNFAKEVADKIIFMDEGQIVETSSPDEFFKEPKTERARRFLNIFKYNN